MPQGQTRPNAQSNGRQYSVVELLANEGQLLKPVRKSTRLQELQRKTRYLLPSPSASNCFGEEACPSGHPNTTLRRLTQIKVPTKSASFRGIP